MGNNHVNIEHDFSKILEGFEKMGISLHKVIPNATMEAAKIIKNAIIKNLPRTKDDEEKTLQWKGKIKYVHMQDDVKITSVKMDKETQDEVRHVRGGKYTHYKWKWLEFGTTRTKKGKEPSHFITKSMKETEREVQSIINEEIKKVVD